MVDKCARRTNALTLIARRIKSGALSAISEVDHDARSLELIARSFDGQTEGLTPDDVLDNVTLLWLTTRGFRQLASIGTWDWLAISLLARSW
jgi:hypothetical protein